MICICQGKADTKNTIVLEAQIGDNGSCYCDNWGGFPWHSDYTAETVMEKRLSNCGAGANLANYLLEGDYEESGFINHAYYPGNGGGHVYNYIKYQGEWRVLHCGLHLVYEPYYYVPEGAEYTVLHQAGDGYLIAEQYLDLRCHDWTVF